MGAVGLDGGDADVDQAGDLLVGAAFGDELEDFALAVGEEVVAVVEAAALELADVVLLEDFAHLAGQERSSLGDGADGLDNVGAERVLEQVALGAGFERPENVALVLVHAEDDHGGPGASRDDAAGGPRGGPFLPRGFHYG